MRIVLRIVLFITILILSACEDSPSSIGLDLIPDQDIIKIDSINSKDASFSQTSSFFIDTLNLGASSRIIIGKDDRLTSTGLIRFFVAIPDSIASDLDTDSVEVVSASVKIVPNYFLNGTAAPFDFTVHKITESWSPAFFTNDSLSDLSFDQADASTNRVISDSLITFELPNDLILEWMKNSRDNTAFENDGLLLKPTDGSQRFIGFQGLSSIAFNEFITLEIDFRKSGAYQDTINSIPSADLHVLDWALPAVEPDKILLHGGISTKGTITFDLSKIPVNALINKATLYLYPDEMQSNMASIPTDTIDVRMFADSTQNEIVANTSVYKLVKIGSSYKGDVSTIVQLWLNDFENQGFRISASDELTSLGYLTIYGSNTADETKRPKLELIYTNRQ